MFLSCCLRSVGCRLKNSAPSTDTIFFGWSAQHYKALKSGDVATVSLIDKGRVIIAMLLAAHMMFRSTLAHIRERAKAKDEGQYIILGLCIIGAVMSLGAIVAELAVARQVEGVLRYRQIGLTILTILSSWAFTQLIFALHYAHDYYAIAR